MGEKHLLAGDDEKVKDGLYLFYIKDERIYPIILKENNWEMLQRIGNSIAGDPARIINMPMGNAEYFTNTKRKERKP